ncbi:unnamed protein product [Polarella glacialis]|uniref:DUS-like FMN-binding domain-containing protein n=1 Tax=Polarella glacialis TaxID=89957 RepID=A0A813E219_POLGL|nr:unnamed protein product [Polarella glacialis]
MSRAVQIPVTVKTRLGVDEFDSQEFTQTFVGTVAQGGCKHFIMHARKAWLSGLSPAQNRSIPPLQHGRVAALCRSFPDLDFSINGGICTKEHASGILLSAPRNLLGVMVGRAACSNPCMLWDVDRCLYGDAENPLVTATRRSIADAYANYLEEAHPPVDEVATKMCCQTHLALKPILGLLSGKPGHRNFRQTMELLQKDRASRNLGPAELLRRTIQVLDQEPKSRAALDEILPFAGEPDQLDSDLTALLGRDAGSRPDCLDSESPSCAPLLGEQLSSVDDASCEKAVMRKEETHDDMCVFAGD